MGKILKKLESNSWWISSQGSFRVTIHSQIAGHRCTENQSQSYILRCKSHWQQWQRVKVAAAHRLHNAHSAHILHTGCTFCTHRLQIFWEDGTCQCILNIRTTWNWEAVDVWVIMIHMHLKKAETKNKAGWHEGRTVVSYVDWPNWVGMEMSERGLLRAPTKLIRIMAFQATTKKWIVPFRGFLKFSFHLFLQWNGYRSGYELTSRLPILTLY